MPARSWTDKDLEKLSKNCDTVTEIVRQLGLKITSQTLCRISRRLKSLGLFNQLNSTKQSKIWTEEQLKEAVKNSASLRLAIEKLGLSPTGGNYQNIGEKIRKLGLETQHFIKQRNVSSPCISDENLFIKESQTRSTIVRRRVLKQNLIENKCAECGLGPQWRGKPLTLHLDHINGNYKDNRIENLRFLCPNCHTQTETYGGKNVKKRHPYLPGLDDAMD